MDNWRRLYAAILERATKDARGGDYSTDARRWLLLSEQAQDLAGEIGLDHGKIIKWAQAQTIQGELTMDANSVKVLMESVGLDPNNPDDVDRFQDAYAQGVLSALNTLRPPTPEEQFAALKNQGLSNLEYAAKVKQLAEQMNQSSRPQFASPQEELAWLGHNGPRGCGMSSGEWTRRMTELNKQIAQRG